uniref:Uncharacterized protein phlA n=1 Tax=Erwinia amylovora ATCC BAA-2158 TaxID=889211 RepID=E5BAF3_ERWAM|nr:hypothetical protein EAIL5_3640 [Erwinia amylovora ATCC BAA-2158]
MYPISRIIRRYEEMVSRYARRPRPTMLPSRQNLTKESPLQQAIATVAATVVATVDSMRPMTKAERWQERKYLIDRGSRSVYPDAMIAARRLAENNIAVEKAKLAQNIYGVKGNPINALKSMPDVPEGWTDISNDNNALSKIDIDPDMLYDRSENPDFFARVYSPDRSIFGSEMNPTLVFRGSRAPELSAGVGDIAKKVLFEGDYSGIKNINDWTNNINQGGGFDSDYYRRAVKIGMKLSKSPNGIDISGHSLGGGMASAASIASGKAAWTFNAAGMNAGTVEKYGGTLVGSAKNIQAYRVEGELLTKIQEVNLSEDYKSVDGNLSLLSAKEGLSATIPDAVGMKHSLPGGKGSLLDRHGIDQAIDCIEGQKDEDIATIRGRI